MRRILALIALLVSYNSPGLAQTGSTRTLSGIVLTVRNEAVAGVLITVRSGPKIITIQSDGLASTSITVASVVESVG
ncbi:MAG TPA: hypothetical protein VGN90_08500 [Pyrinomonadaceae bacterium]|jgi:hypothetical protein|nr:hypothetical protein [Pyrinomonadaceae bacterium]